MSGRFLRSPKLRNILFRSADGCCANCGQPLQDGWHADHKVPYVITGRTNLFEMDALCPRCNTAKGASMLDSMAGATQIDLEPMRPGVRGAINALWGNVRAGKPTTGIVLPTRYGKSDVIKMGGLGLLLDGLASYIVVLEPATVLAQQILDPSRMEASAQRYNVPSAIATGITRWVMNNSPIRPFPPRDAKFVSLTVQMANLNREFFEDWIDHIKYQRMPVPVFFVDEAHTGSIGNEWGATATALQKAGAHLVLLTATPNRTDKTFIAGFDYEQVRTEPTTVRRGMEVWRGDRVTYRLVPDHETTFSQAWAELPPALCYIARIPIAVEMARYGFGENGEKAITDISEVPASRVRSALAEIIRDDYVVKACCSEFVKSLKERKQNFPATAGIVFVGNDLNREDDAETNSHARRVAEALRQFDKSLDIKIATSTYDEDPRGVLDDFQNGKGDILIVKQMGGVGMDVPRLKVCLDLSTFRTEALYVQRICRVATVWQPTDDPDDLVLTATYITPDDPFSEALFDNFIRREGGDAETVTPAELDYIRTETSQQQRLPDLYVPTGNTSIGHMKDTEQRTAEGSWLAPVRKLASVLPEVLNKRTEPELANIMERENIVIDPENRVHHGYEELQVVPTTAPVQIRDLNAEHNLARGKVSNLARRVANKRKKAGDTDPYLYPNVFTEHKRRCRIPVGKALEHMEIMELERMSESLQQELAP